MAYRGQASFRIQKRDLVLNTKPLVQMLGLLSGDSCYLLVAGEPRPHLVWSRRPHVVAVRGSSALSPGSSSSQRSQLHLDGGPVVGTPLRQDGDAAVAVDEVLLQHLPLDELAHLVEDGGSSVRQRKVDVDPLQLTPLALLHHVDNLVVD